MDKPEIKITYESVTFVGCEGSGNHLFRPHSMSVSQWTRFWEAVQAMDAIESERLREELKEAKEEIASLEREVEDLEERISELGNGI